MEVVPWLMLQLLGVLGSHSSGCFLQLCLATQQQLLLQVHSVLALQCLAVRQPFARWSCGNTLGSASGCLTPAGLGARAQQQLCQ